jgi:hypothetical protein
LSSAAAMAIRLSLNVRKKTGQDSTTQLLDEASPRFVWSRAPSRDNAVTGRLQWHASRGAIGLLRKRRGLALEEVARCTGGGGGPRRGLGAGVQALGVWSGWQRCARCAWREARALAQLRRRRRRRCTGGRRAGSGAPGWPWREARTLVRLRRRRCCGTVGCIMLRWWW